MTFALHCLDSVLNVKEQVGAFNQEKAPVGAFSVIVKTDCETGGSFYSTNPESSSRAGPGGRGQRLNTQFCIIPRLWLMYGGGLTS